MRVTHMLTFTLLCVTLAVTSIIPAQAATKRAGLKDKNWIVYYSNTHKSSEFSDYDVIVFDRDKHPPIQNLKAAGKTLLGYVSAGEAEKYRPDYKTIQDKNLLMEENPHWPGHFSVDVRNPEWTRYLVEDVIPSIIQRGFHGIFVDTLDSVEDLEVQQPQKYKGMIKASANMIKTIRHHYPDLKIMINRGFEIMPYIAQDVDYLLLEGVMVNYDFEGGNHKLFPDHIYQEYVQKVKALKIKAPHLKVMALDYWHMDDTNMIKTIYKRHRQNGFLPYVTTIELDRLDKEPL